MSDRLDVLFGIREVYKYSQDVRTWIDHEIDQLMASELRRSRIEERAKSFDDIRVFQAVEYTTRAMSTAEISEITGLSTQKVCAITRRLYALGLLEREVHR